MNKMLPLHISVMLLKCCVIALVAVILLFYANNIAYPVEIRVGSLNVESGDSDPEIVGNLIAKNRDIDVWGLSEVRDEKYASIFKNAAEEKGANFETLLGTSGGNDRLLIIFNAKKLSLINYSEISRINVLGRARAPLVAQLRLQTGIDFYFMVNHLYRSIATRRHEQSRLLNDWAQAQKLPIIAVGTYYYDWSVIKGEDSHDVGYDFLTGAGVFNWIKPDKLLPTQCYLGQKGPQGFIQDFIFVAGEAKYWKAFSEILPIDPSYCPDNKTRSDHRLVVATFTIGKEKRHEITTKEKIQRAIYLTSKEKERILTNEFLLEHLGENWVRYEKYMDMVRKFMVDNFGVSNASDQIEFFAVYIRRSDGKINALSRASKIPVKELAELIAKAVFTTNNKEK